MEARDGIWTTSIEISAESKAALIKKVAAIKRLSQKIDKEKERRRRAQGEGSIYTRGDGMVVGRLELERHADGKRRRSKPVYSKDHAVVVKKLEALKKTIAEGREQLDETLTLADWLDYWLEEIAPAKTKPHALKTYRSHVRNQIQPAIGHRKVAKLKPEDVRALHKWIREAKYVKGKDKKTGEPIRVPYSERTVEAAHTVLSSAMSDAVAEEKAHRNPCELVPAPNGSSGEGTALSTEQARAVLLAAMRANDRMVTRWAAGLMLGGRQGEILGLQWDRIDFEAGTLDLAWQLEWLPLKPGAKPDDPKRFDVRPGFEHTPLWRGAALTRPKTDLSQRLIPLPEPLAAILQVHRKTWKPNPWGLVWTTAKGTPVSDRADREGWAEAQRRAEVDPVQVRRMRDTTATLLMEANVPDKVIQSIMGHTNVMTTRGYQRVDLSQSRKALGNLDVLLAVE
ncbi:hypothetical protein C5E45_32775 [Nocardia nova]|uniref:Site-specific integrase n=1 Tax=Nocardia nova TaxID=37330 RepID=A0A2S6ACQ7_9NOCA|nr:site-specific integrase [Nocardia nova]PPJ31866.1 hypothetical protein C5E45_32775 [Nocardia nova]